MSYGFDDYETKCLAKRGYTPETARDLVVKKLKKANLVKEELDYLLRPIEELTYSETELILNMVLYYKDEPEGWISRRGKDFSDRGNFISFRNYMDS